MTGRTAAVPAIGVGIVGASATRGWAGVAHIPALKALEGFEIRGVSTTKMESAQATARQLGIDLAFDDHRPLVARPEIDLVVVAVKVPDHRRIVSDALAAGKMVFCEWPLARNLSEAESLVDLARGAGVRTMIGLQASVHPPIQYVRDLIRDGAIGVPISSSIRAHPTEPQWYGHFDPQFEFMAESANGATMLTIAVGHTLEALAQVLGEFESVSAILANQRGDGKRTRDGSPIANDAPDEIAVIGRLKSGVVSSLHYSAGEPCGPLMTWEIQGTTGSLMVRSNVAGYLQFGGLAITLRRRDGRPEELSIPDRYYHADLGLTGPATGVARLYQGFAADIREGRRSVPDFSTALARHAVIDAIMRSAATGDRIQISTK